MNIVFVLAPLSLALAGFFVFLFFRSVNEGQFQDLETPAHRILIDSVPVDSKEKTRVES